MEIFSDRQRDGLQYVGAANSGGYQPTEDEVNEWVFRRERRPAKRGPLLAPAKPSAFAIMRDSQRASILTYIDELHKSRLSYTDFFSQASTFFQGTPAEYGPGQPEESYVNNMIRLSWLSKNTSGGLSLTPLGRALLRSDALTSENDDDATVVVLEAGSELSYPQLIGHIADSGEAFVIDPYVRANHLWPLMINTSTTRVLIGPGMSKKDLAELRQLLTLAPRDIEVRQAGKGVLHDRFIIGDLGVHQIGASWNGVGKVVTTLFQHPRVTADRLIAIADEWWSNAIPVEPIQPIPTNPPEPPADPAPSLS